MGIPDPEKLIFLSVPQVHHLKKHQLSIPIVVRIK